jgi:predicted nucleic acid-binding protein
LEGDGVRHAARRRFGRPQVIPPDESVLTVAADCLQRHDLRAADALQLAAALMWAHGVRGRPFVVTDGRLRTAAAASGFDVRP